MSNSKEERCVTNNIEKTIRIDEDVDMKTDFFQSSYSLETIKCVRCAEYLENGQRAWQMCANYAEKLREIDSLRASLQQKEAYLRERCEYIELMESSTVDMSRKMADNASTILQIRSDLAQKKLHIQHLSSEMARIKSYYNNVQANGVKSREEYEKRILDLEANLTLMIGSNYRILAGKHQSAIDERDSIIKLLKQDVLASRRPAEQSEPVTIENPEEVAGFVQKELECQDPIVENITFPISTEKLCPTDKFISLPCVLPAMQPFSNELEEIPKSSVVEFSKTEEEVTAQNNKAVQQPKKSIAAGREIAGELAPAVKRLRKPTDVLDSNRPMRLTDVGTNRSFPTSAFAAQLAILKRVKGTSVRKLPVKKKQLKPLNSTPVKVAVPEKQLVATTAAEAVVGPVELEKRKSLRSNQKKAIMLSEIPKTGALGGDGRRAAAIGRQTVQGAANSLDSCIISTFKAINNSISPVGLKKNLMRKYPDLVTTVSVEKLATLMCKALLEMDMGDLWLSLSGRNNLVRPASRSSIMATDEKKFFEFAELLSLEDEWGCLLTLFSSQFAKEVLKSVKEEATSTSQLSRNFRCLAYTRVLMSKHAREDQDLLKQHGCRLLSLLEYLQNERSPSYFVPIFCYLVRIDKELVLSSFFSVDADSLRYHLLRLHFNVSDEYSSVVREILGCYSSFSLVDSSLFTPPGSVEVALWINEILEQGRDMKEGIIFDGQNFKVSKELLRKARDCSAIFSPRFAVLLDRYAIVFPHLCQILEVLAKASGESVRLDENALAVDSPLYHDTLLRPAEDSQPEIGVIAMEESLAAANLAIVVGRLCRLLLQSHHDTFGQERVNSTLARIRRFLEGLKSDPERTPPKELLVFAVEAYIIFD